jgi:hypothetical protein
MRSNRICYMAAAFFAVTGITQHAAAQISEERTHVYNGYDVKNYAIDKEPSRQLCVLAGTIFDPNGTEDNSINLMITDNFPGIIGNTIVDRQFDDIGYDERAIGVHYINSNTNDIVVVASRRDLNAPGETNIEILRADGSGTLQPSAIVRDPNGRLDMHPMGTLAVGSDLYICGYTTRLGTAIPNYRTSKQIFIVKFDLNTNNVVASKAIDYSYPTLQYDFDMAVRMKAMRNGLIYVTGSCSGYYTVTPPPNWDPLSDGYYCATLSLFLDNALNIRSDQPFSEFSGATGWPNPDRLARGEYGNDIVEAVGPGGGYYVFGNTYVAYPTDPNPFLQFFTITYIDPQFLVPGTLRNRYRGPDFDYGWGIDVEDGNSPGWYVLSGIQTSRGGLSNPPYPTSMSNINPFLAEIRPDYSGGTMTLSTNYWNTILSDEGTGNISLYPNNYYDLGGFNSHLAWSPRNTTRGFDWTNDIFLSAPVWNPYGYNKLNMKTIRTLPNGQVECPDEAASPGGVVYDAPESIRGAVSLTNFVQGITLSSETETDFRPDDIVNCLGTGIFKPTGINSIESGLQSVTIAPNPAHTSIAITLQGDYSKDNTFKVVLTDMTGRHIADLYQGNQAGLTTINLPVLAPGLYVVNVSSAAGKFKSQLLTIK